MDDVEFQFKRAVAECLPDLLRVYLIKTRLECASHLYEVGGLTRRLFAEELENMRDQLIKLG